MIGPIRGHRLPSSVKLQICRAILQAKAHGATLEGACRVIMLDPRRLRRWLEKARKARPPVWASAPAGPHRPPGEPIGPGGPKGPGGATQAIAAQASEALRASQGPLRGSGGRSLPVRDPSELCEADLADRRPVARRLPHRLTEGERQEILRAASEDRLAHLRHRKLCHTLSREGRVFASESTVLRVLRQAGQVPVYIRRRRPTRPRPVVDESRPNRSWRYDLTRFPTRAGDYHLVPVIDGCSRKIVGRSFGPEATSASVQAAWEKSLAQEGLLTEEAPPLPWAVSDRGTQMTSKSTQAFFADLGIAQSFSRPRTPTDNATCESWMATLKCERLYEADTAELSPWEVEEMVDRFIDYYNNERLHQALGFVTPAERHEGRHTTILEARRRGMEQAREERREEAYGGVREPR